MDLCWFKPDLHLHTNVPVMAIQTETTVTVAILFVLVYNGSQMGVHLMDIH